MIKEGDPSPELLNERFEFDLAVFPRYGFRELSSKYWRESGWYRGFSIRPRHDICAWDFVFIKESKMGIVRNNSNRVAKISYQDHDDSIVDDLIVKVLEDTCGSHPNGIALSTLMSHLKKREQADFPTIMFREAIWRLMDRGRIELTSDRLLKIQNP